MPLADLSDKRDVMRRTWHAIAAYTGPIMIITISGACGFVLCIGVRAV
ncbi:hypothetical protein ACQEU8_02300 [Streptomyces sp. CA-250714]